MQGATRDERINNRLAWLREGFSGWMTDEILSKFEALLRDETLDPKERDARWAKVWREDVYKATRELTDAQRQEMHEHYLANESEDERDRRERREQWKAARDAAMKRAGVESELPAIAASCSECGYAWTIPGFQRGPNAGHYSYIEDCSRCFADVTITVKWDSVEEAPQCTCGDKLTYQQSYAYAASNFGGIASIGGGGIKRPVHLVECPTQVPLTSY